MRQMIVVALLLGPLLEPAVGQAVAPASPATPNAAPKRQATPAEKSARDSAVASCEQMWDRATHMTKLEWSRTCQRVQDRLDTVQDK